MRSFCAPVALILLNTSDALVVSSVTQADDRCLETQLYEKSYPALHEKEHLPLCEKRTRKQWGTVFGTCSGGEKMVENHTRGYDLS